jgi:hypothetical protein
MKSVYACSKADGTLALAMDIVAIDDQKMIGKLLQIAGESGLIVDRVDREAVIFEDPALIRAARDKAKDKAQLEIDFSKPAAGDRGGPSEMPEGFSCNYSGECPTPSKACATCEHASNGIPKSVTVTPEVAEVVAESEIQPEGESNLAEDMKVSTFMQWATMSPEERAAAGIEKPEGLTEVSDEPLEDIDPEDETEDGSEFGQDEPRSDDTDGGNWENASESEPDEGQEAREMDF